MKTMKYILTFVMTAMVMLLAASRAMAETVVWSENFDDGNGGDRWASDQGIWQIGSPTIGPATNSAGCRAHSCPNCATTGLTANYPSGGDSRLFQIGRASCRERAQIS